MRHMKQWAWLAMLASFLAGLAACESILPIRAETPGQTVVEMYGTTEKAYAVTAQLLDAGLISSASAKKRRDDIDGARAALDAYSEAVNLGDLSTAVGRLQAAKLAVDALAGYLDTQGGAAQ